MAHSTDDELSTMVDGIVDELEAAVSGTLYDVDDNETVIEDIDEWKQEQYDIKVAKFKNEHPESEFGKNYDEWRENYGYDCYRDYLEDEIGTVDDIEEPDKLSLSDYIEKRSLDDVRFEVDTGKNLSGGRILFTYGGPNIWVHDDMVCGYWGSYQCTTPLNSDTRSALWEWFEEQWNAIRG